jgi:hypothetical protein
MLVASRSVILALIGRPATRAPLVSTMTAVATMSSMAERVHSD